MAAKVPRQTLFHPFPVLHSIYYLLAADAGLATSLPSAVEEERRHLVEAAIVRILKARKTISHNDLVAEVNRQLCNRFIPTPAVRSPSLYCFSSFFLTHHTCVSHQKAD